MKWGKVILAGTLVIGHAHAEDQFNAETAAQCKRIGEFARRVAEQRDAGIDRAAILKQLPAGNTAARRTVAMLYDDPSITPTDAAVMELTCLLNAGREPIKR